MKESRKYRKTFYYNDSGSATQHICNQEKSVGEVMTIIVVFAWADFSFPSFKPDL